MNPLAHDAVLLIAFGGPTAMDEVRPFLDNVLRGRPVPPERLEAVVHHYELIGGRSPLTELTLRQADGLAAALRAHGPALPVYVGMRNWQPYLRDALTKMAAHGVRQAVGVILAAQQSDAGWDRYQREVAEAQAQIGPAAPEVVYVDDGTPTRCSSRRCATRSPAPWSRCRPAPRRGRAGVHGAQHPVRHGGDGALRRAVRGRGVLVADDCGLDRWQIAYQSRSGNPRDPWLGPDILDVLRSLAAEGVRDVVLLPIGFVCDHVEVLYDLDIEARQVADAIGVRVVRAATVNDHPLFIRMLADVVRTRLAAGKPAQGTCERKASFESALGSCAYS